MASECRKKKGKKMREFEQCLIRKANAKQKLNQANLAEKVQSQCRTEEGGRNSAMFRVQMSDGKGGEVRLIKS